jgi:hypothetical protein
MSSIGLTQTSFAYIDSDIPEGQTLLEWRCERNAARHAERRARRPRRTLRLPRLSRLPRLRPAW